MIRTKASTYAILAVAEIARRQQEHHSGVQAADIASCLNFPGAYAAKVLTQLARAGVLQSDRGPRGGFRMTRPPETIALLEIVEAVDGEIAAGVEVPGGFEESHQALHSLDQVFNQVAAQVRMLLSECTIANLLKLQDQVTTQTANKS